MIILFLLQIPHHVVVRVLARQETRELGDGRVEAAADVPSRRRRRLGDEQLRASEVVDVAQRHRAAGPLGQLEHAEPDLVA